MELLGSHSKEYDITRYVGQVLEWAQSSKRPQSAAAPSRAAQRLTSAQRQELIAAYQAGASTYELAARFNIRRDTVTARLRRAGVEVRPGPQVALDEAGEQRVATLYRDGLSMRSIARQMGISDNTVLKALRAQGVPSRTRVGGRLKASGLAEEPG